MSADPSRVSRTGEPTPVFGSLGTALSRALTPIVTVVSIAAVVIAIAIAVWLGDIAVGLEPTLGYIGAIWSFALGASILVVLTIASIAILPPLLLRGRDRAATVVHSWVGAREVRRALGRPGRIVSLIGTPSATARWLERTPATDALRPVRFEAFLLLGRIDEARAEADHFTRRTPWEEYRYLEAHALVDEQEGIALDERSLRDAIARIPPGVERTEAEASLAVNLARRALPDGDWRRPLVAVRPSVPGSDAIILVRDFGVTTFEVLLRSLGLAIIVLIGLLAIFLSFAPTFT
jgi:hypothetical protein